VILTCVPAVVCNWNLIRSSTSKVNIGHNIPNFSAKIRAGNLPLRIDGGGGVLTLMSATSIA